MAVQMMNTYITPGKLFVSLVYAVSDLKEKHAPILFSPFTLPWWIL